MTPFLNFGLGIQSGSGVCSPSGLSSTLDTRSTITRTVSLLAMPSWELPVSPNASSAEAVTASRGADLGVADAGQELRQLVVDREQLGLLLVVGREGRLLGVAVADPQVGQHVVVVLERVAVALGDGLGLDLAGVHRALPLHLGRRADVAGDGDRVEPVVGLAVRRAGRRRRSSSPHAVRNSAQHGEQRRDEGQARGGDVEAGSTGGTLTGEPESSHIAEPGVALNDRRLTSRRSAAGPARRRPGTGPCTARCAGPGR